MKKGYVDGFVLVVPKKKFAAYKKMAQEGSAVWKKFGALGYYECVGEDLKIKGKGMENRSFTEMAKATPSEQVWYSFVLYKNRAHRDSVNKKVMAYFTKKYDEKAHANMPFDMRKMAYGGFRTIVER